MAKKKVKKTPIEFNGTPLTQVMRDNKFIQEYQEWESFCRGVSGTDLKVKNIPTLFDMLNQHITDENTRLESINRKQGKIGQGGISVLGEISKILNGDSFTVLEVLKIQELAEELAEMKDTSLDPATIRFTEQLYTSTGRKRGDPVERLGHYRTKTYVDRRKAKGKDDGLGGPVDDSWLSGNNPPHQALFSEGASDYAKPRGLLGILEDAEENLRNIKIQGVEVSQAKGDAGIARLSEVSVIRDFFDNVVNTQGFWRSGQGKLMPSNVQKEISAMDFSGLNRKDKDIIREVAGLGKRTERASLYGDLESFTLKLSVGAVVRLVDDALKRKGKEDGYYRAPDGYIAWNGVIQSGFDYRKTRKEVNPDKYKDTNSSSANAKTISKSWADILRG